MLVKKTKIILNAFFIGRYNNHFRPCIHPLVPHLPLFADKHFIIVKISTVTLKRAPNQTCLDMNIIFFSIKIT